MNTQMRKLAGQAAKWVCENEPRSMDDEELFRELSMEKFAELIVRECQLRVEQYINECGEVASIPDTVIMKHFGVGE